MMNQWFEVFTLVVGVECSSLVTRITTNMGLLHTSLLSLIRLYIDFEYVKLICLKGKMIEVLL